MADDIVKFTAGSDAYVPLGAGAEAVAVGNDSAYQNGRIVISDTPPDPDHAAYHILPQRHRVQHDEILNGNVLYIRADKDGETVSGHYRRFL